MLTSQLTLEGLCLFEPRVFRDDRGYFHEAFNLRSFANATGWTESFVQDNESMSMTVGTVRGLHYQLSPSAQGKLVRVPYGSVLDVAVDIRRTSPTFGQHAAVELSAHNGLQLWVPPGFAHGFCTLEPKTVVAYKVDAYYDPARERSINWREPSFAIEWPVISSEATLSDRDHEAPMLSAVPVTELF